VKRLRSRDCYYQEPTEKPHTIYSNIGIEYNNNKDVISEYRWKTVDGIEVVFFPSVTMGEWETGLTRLDGKAPEVRLQVRARYPGSDAEGSVMVRDNYRISPSLPDSTDYYCRIISRVDGSIVLAFDQHGWANMEKMDRASEKPEWTRRLIFIWDKTYNQPIAVTDWKGASEKLPDWARMDSLLGL